MLIGLGVDSHRFEEQKTKPFVLGGVEFDEPLSMKANSDGDLILHALCNAIGSAIGEGSLSNYADKMCLEQGIKDSKEYLKFILKEAEKKGWKVKQVVVSLECKKPKIEVKREKIQESLAKLLNVKKEKIGITATSGEGLTDVGRGDGIYCIVNILMGRLNENS